jgi:hypothetical protein
VSSVKREEPIDLDEDITSVLRSGSIHSKIDQKEQNMAVNHVSFFFGARAAGALVFSLIGGVALENFSKSKVFMLSACFPLMLFFYTLFIFEEKPNSQYSEEATAEEIREIVESHLKQIKPELNFKEEKPEDKPIVFDQGDQIIKSRTFKYVVRPSENQETYNVTNSKNANVESNEGILHKIKTRLGFSTKNEDGSLKQSSRPTKTKYDFGTFNSKGRTSRYDEDTCYSVSDNFSMIYNKQRPNFLRDFKKILYVMKHPKIRRLIILVSLVMITPMYSSTWNYYLTNVIKLQPEDMGELNFTASCGYLLGILAMNFIFTDTKLKTFYRATTIISSILLCTGLFILLGWYKKLGVDPKVFCATNAVVSNFFNEINILPILALCCRFCPKKLEAMSYAVFMSITWVTYITSQLFGIIILYYFKVSQDDFTNFWKCIICQTVYGCAMALVISLVSFPENFSDVSEFINSKDFIRFFVFKRCRNQKRPIGM